MILVLAGTQDGRMIAEALANRGLDTWATTVTDYGGELISKKVKVRTGPLDKKDLVTFIRENRIQLVIDATHPFARDISLTAIEGCEELGVKYIRFERESTDKIYSKLIKVKDFDEALEMVEKYNRIFLTIGSKHLDKFAGLLDRGKKLTTRVLPRSNILKKCEDLGFPLESIIAMKGPFTTEMNYHMFKESGAQVIITKDSGIIGGVLEKLKAASSLNIPVVFVQRPPIEYPMVVRNMKELFGMLS